MNKVTRRALLSRIEAFYDAVPRRGAAVEQMGGLTLFVRDGAGWPLYARPTLGGPEPDVNTVRRVRARQRELGVPEEFEWVDEVTPGLAATARSAGLDVRRCPLMVLDPAALGAEPTRPPTPGASPVVTFLTPHDDGELASGIRAVGAAAFGAPAPSPAPLDPGEADGLRSGAIARAAIADETGLVCAGSYQRAANVVEIVGVGTVPTARRRGLATVVTAALAAHALANGAELVFLSAGDADVARLYGRLGFSQVATACLAEPNTL